MSFLTTTAAVAAATLALAAGFGQAFGPSIETEIEISAPPEAVWQVLADGAAYPDWNPFVRQLDGDLAEGARLDVRIAPPSGDPMSFAPMVLVADENVELRWRGKLGVRGIFDGEHAFRLEETAQGTTILHHGESFRGLLGYPLFALVGTDTKAGFEAMNRALKSRVEART